MVRIQRDGDARADREMVQTNGTGHTASPLAAIHVSFDWNNRLVGIEIDRLKGFSHVQRDDELHTHD